MSTHSSAGRATVPGRGFAGLLFAAMGAATFTMTALSILASYIIDELGITREQLGFAVTANVALAALLSPWTGMVTDRVGGKRALLGIFLVGGCAFLMMGAATTYWVLLVAAIVAAFSQSAGNPATNKLIALHIEDGSRGFVTGIKQSGVQAVTFVGGVLLPLGAERLGWRSTLVIAGIVTVGFVVPSIRVVPADEPGRDGAVRGAGRPLHQATVWLAVYGALLGFGGSATFFVPLFAEEAVGYGTRAAGLAAALIGLIGLFGRIAWARLAERSGRYLWSLGAIAMLSFVSAIVFLSATSAAVMLWVAVLIVGFSSSSWTAVGMLTVMHEAGHGRAGRASGRVMFGFLVGLGIAPPFYGRTVDATGSYTIMWLVAVGAFAAAALLVAVWSRRLQRGSAPA